MSPKKNHGPSIREVVRKRLRKTGNSIGIIFNKQDRDVYQLNEGDVITLEIHEVRR